MWPRTFLMVMSIPAPSVQSSDVEDSLFPQLRQRPVLLAPAGGAYLGPKLEAFVAGGAHGEIPQRHRDPRNHQEDRADNHDTLERANPVPDGRSRAAESSFHRKDRDLTSGRLRSWPSFGNVFNTLSSVRPGLSALTVMPRRASATAK